MEVPQPVSPQSTEPTSPLTPPPSSDTVLPAAEGADGENSQYRIAKELPFELAQHVQTYFEETLFAQGFDFLISLVSNSISPTTSNSAMLVPNPPHLALAATIIIHPSFTTRTTLREKWNQANSALRLLRLILNTAGPVNANFAEAFHFNKYANRPLNGGAYESEEDDEYDSTLKTCYASSDSLFTLADDFWSLVGWAFNCASLLSPYAPRWAHYELLLAFLLDLLEANWNLHFTNNTSEESLIWQFIELATGGHGRARRIMRAIFADGSTRSLNEFHEIFRHELKPAKDEDTKASDRRVAKVNIEKNEYGDYLGADDSDVSDNDDDTISINTRPSKRARTRTPSRRTTPRTSNESLRSAYEDEVTSSTSTTTTLGSPTAFRLRIRLLHLLSNISGHPTLLSTSPTTFPDLTDLYVLFVEFIKPLPLPLYTLILSPSTTSDVLSTDASTTLAEFMLQRLMESSAPLEIEDETFLTVRKFVRCYAPWAAGGRGTVGEQARVSVAVEGLLRRCVMAGMLKSWTPAGEEGGVRRKEFLDAVEGGVERREALAREMMERKRDGKRGRGKGKGREEDEEEAWKALRASGVRIRMVLRELP